MTSIQVEATIETDGELHLTELPCRKGDRVQAIVMILDSPLEQAKRDEARERFLALARASTFRSTAAYPSREELHELR
jgi:hypothetical protein